MEEASGGRLGYVHLPDTFVAAATELGRSWYSQTTREGIVVDGRYNAGGLDPDPFLERLARRPQAYWTRRQSADQVTPMYSSRAHLVCLTDRNAGSGGDELPFQFRQRGLGPVIGTRSWGGLVGISTAYQLLDGSEITVPEYRIYSPSGDWVVENEGVTPDIEVELDQRARLAGRDSQLETAIEVLLAAVAAEPRPAPTRPPFPTSRP